MRILFCIIMLLFFQIGKAQYTSYFTGSIIDLRIQPTKGIVLMGGATENDNAMRWFLEKANGGDVIVIRTSGSDGYNDYLFSDLGIAVNSVETLVLPSRAAATNSYVRTQLEGAEAIWIAGGDQATYNEYWKNTAVDSAVNRLLNEKKGVVGGTSAGMAILSGFYFFAGNGSVGSATALANPYNSAVTIGNNDFIHAPMLASTITDTHFDNPNRKGRLMTFMARIMQDNPGTIPNAIACEEYTAVCIDSNGVAKVFGNAPADEDYAYFLQVNCENADPAPEICSPGLALEWNRAAKAVKVYKVPGTQTGLHGFNIATLSNGTGGTWENWWVTSQAFNSAVSAAPQCSVVGVSLLDFKVAEAQQGIQIRWRVMEERNLLHYTVQSSTNGNEYSNIAIQIPSAIQQGIKTYAVLDNRSLLQMNGRIFYRLQIKDRDGSVSYSPVQTLNINKSTKLTVAPNPLQNNGKVLFGKSVQSALLRIYDAKAALVISSNVTGSFYELPAGKLPPGMYSAQLVTREGTTRVVFIVE